jgi:hypothetical protein
MFGSFKIECADDASEDAHLVAVLTRAAKPEERTLMEKRSLFSELEEEVP